MLLFTLMLPARADVILIGGGKVTPQTQALEKVGREAVASFVREEGGYLELLPVETNPHFPSLWFDPLSLSRASHRKQITSNMAPITYQPPKPDAQHNESSGKNILSEPSSTRTNPYFT
jgi:hypothetical protein